MLALSILAALSAPAQTAKADDIVVVARKLQDWRAVLIVGQGDALRCKVLQSTGDAVLDAKGCDAMEQCFATTRPNFAAAQGKALSAIVRKRLLADARTELAGCMRESKRRIAIAAALDQTAVSDDQ